MLYRGELKINDAFIGILHLKDLKNFKNGL